MFTKVWSTISNSLKLELELLKDWNYCIIPYVEPRNYEQLKLYWVLLTYVQNQTWNDKEYIAEMMKKKFLSTKKLVKLGKKRNYVTKIWSTRNLNKKQMSEYYEKCERFFAELWYTLPNYDSQEFISLYNSI